MLTLQEYHLDREVPVCVKLTVVGDWRDGQEVEVLLWRHANLSLMPRTHMTSGEEKRLHKAVL